MNIPHWLNPDGTLKSGVAYWVYENYQEWADGRHNAHVHAYYKHMADVAFREYRFYRSVMASSVYDSALNPHNDGKNPRAYVRALRRETPEIFEKGRIHGGR